MENQRSETPRPLLTYQQASVFLGMPVGTLYYYVSMKRIPFIRFSSRIVRFDLQELECWIDRHRVETVPERGR